jgi:hypothetical protein
MPGIPPEPVGILGVFPEKTSEHIKIVNCETPRITRRMRVGTAWRCPVCRTGWQIIGSKQIKSWIPEPRFDGIQLKLKDGRIKPPTGKSGISR